MNELLTFELAGHEAYRYTLAFLIILASLIFKRIFDKFISKKLHYWAEKTDFPYDDILIRSLSPPFSALIFSLGIFIALFMFELPREPYNIPAIITEAYHITLALIAVWAAYRLCDLVTEVVKHTIAQQDREMAEQFTPVVRQAIRITVIILGGILIVQNMGYSVSSLVAGLGIGGLAIALAAQDTIANVFGTVVMFTDKPFRLGDWIKFKHVDGFVEEVGFRSIKLRTWSNTLMYIPNKMITSEVVENCTSMKKRRVKMTIGLQYDSPPDKMRKLVAGIREMLENDTRVNQEYMLVRFNDFGPSSLNIFLYYFTKSTVWADYLEVREDINLKIMDLVHELGLSFAFPSSTLYFGNTLSVEQTRDEDSNP
ncbi:MAG: mechanosensitive ion channel family protein [Gemmatimonadota bacterium]|nr:mechanosensitive ion channel family protein [Gemmatimonadota bacterium]